MMFNGMYVCGGVLLKALSLPTITPCTVIIAFKKDLTRFHRWWWRASLV